MPRVVAQDAPHQVVRVLAVLTLDVADAVHLYDVPVGQVGDEVLSIRPSSLPPRISTDPRAQGTKRISQTAVWSRATVLFFHVVWESEVRHGRAAAEGGAPRGRPAGWTKTRQAGRRRTMSDQFVRCPPLLLTGTANVPYIVMDWKSLA